MKLVQKLVIFPGLAASAWSWACPNLQGRYQTVQSGKTIVIGIKQSGCESLEIENDVEGAPPLRVPITLDGVLRSQENGATLITGFTSGDFIQIIDIPIYTAMASQDPNTPPSRRVQDSYYSKLSLDAKGDLVDSQLMTQDNVNFQSLPIVYAKRLRD